MREAGTGQGQLRVSREFARYRLHLVGVKRLGGKRGALDEYMIISLFMENEIKMERIFFIHERTVSSLQEITGCW
jgi:hypothetical protein